MNDEEEIGGCYVAVKGGVAWALNVTPDRNLLPLAFSRSERRSMREAAKALKQKAAEAAAPSDLDENEDHDDDDETLDQQTSHQSSTITSDLGSPMATIAAPPLSAERMGMIAINTSMLQPRRIQPPVRTVTDVLIDGECLTVGPDVAANVAAQHVAAIIQEQEWQGILESMPADKRREELIAAEAARRQTITDHEAYLESVPNMMSTPPTGLEIKLGYHRKPRGPVPVGKKWNHGTGQWVDEAAEIPNLVDPKSAAKRKKSAARKSRDAIDDEGLYLGMGVFC